MFRCKCCRKVLAKDQMTAALRKVCKSCYNDTQRYCRLLGKKKLTQSELGFISDMEETYRRNYSRGGYYPVQFITPETDRTCQRCDEAFTSKSNSKLCSQCRETERRFKTYKHTNPTGPAYLKLVDYYKQLAWAGKHVPKEFRKTQE